MMYKNKLNTKVRWFFKINFGSFYEKSDIYERIRLDIYYGEANWLKIYS